MLLVLVGILPPSPLPLSTRTDEMKVGHYLWGHGVRSTYARTYHKNLLNVLQIQARPLL